jgi:hypothetical protein
MVEVLSLDGRKMAVVEGTVALDGSNPTTIATGLSKIYGAAVNLTGSAAPALSTSTLSWTKSGGSLNIYAWKPTGAGDTTLVASTGTEIVSYLVVGER